MPFCMVTFLLHGATIHLHLITTGMFSCDFMAKVCIAFLVDRMTTSLKLYRKKSMKKGFASNVTLCLTRSDLYIVSFIYKKPVRLYFL